MAKNVVHDFLHILRRRVGTTVHKRVAAGGEVQGERRAGRGTVLDHRVGLARLEYDLEDVVANLLVAVDVVQRGAKRLDVAGSANRLRLWLLGSLGKALHDAPLVRLRRRLDEALEHKAVDLRFGKRIGAFLLDRVLRREDKERLRERVCLVANRHLALLHRLEKRRLHLRRSAVYFVCEQQVSEHRPLLRRELASLRRVDERTDDVGRKKVRGERDAPELEPERLSESVARKRLGETGNALEEDMTVCDHGEDESVDELLLPDDDLAHLFAYLRHELLLRGDPVRCFLQVHFISPCVV